MSSIKNIVYEPPHILLNDLRILTGKKHLQNKIPALTKSTKMGICFVGISNQLFIRGSDKNKVVTGKTSFFVIGAFCAHHFICLNIWLLIWQFCMEVVRFQS